MPAHPRLYIERSLALLGLALLLQLSTAPAQGPLSKASSAQYLKAGDPVAIHLTGAPRELTLATYVQRGGSIDVAPAAAVQVDGLSLTDAAQQVKSALEVHFSRPGVTLSPIVLGGSKFFITGDVHKPGSYAASTGLTVRQAVFSVAGNVTLWCRRPWYFRILEKCSAKVSIVRPDARGNIAFLTSEVTDGSRTGSEAVLAGDLLNVRVLVGQTEPD